MILLLLLLLSKRPQKPYGLLGTGRRVEGVMEAGGEGADDDELMLNVLRCQLTY